MSFISSGLLAPLFRRGLRTRKRRNGARSDKNDVTPEETTLNEDMHSAVGEVSFDENTVQRDDVLSDTSEGPAIGNIENSL